MAKVTARSLSAITARQTGPGSVPGDCHTPPVPSRGGHEVVRPQGEELRLIISKHLSKQFAPVHSDARI